MRKLHSKCGPVLARIVPLALLLIGAVLLLAVTGCDSKPDNWSFTSDRSTGNTDNTAKSQDNSANDNSTNDNSTR